MSIGRKLLATVLAGAMIVIAAVLAGMHVNQTEAVQAAGRNEIAANGNVQGRLYPGDPEQEAALVEREEGRLEYVRTVVSSLEWQLDGLDGPYRIPTVPASTLVLPARAEPYTFAELREVAPDTLVEQADGSFLLSEHVVVQAGATLDLRTDVPLRLLLASDANTFVSLVSLGGVLNVAGSDAARVTIASRDTGSGGPDTNTADGRAYVRAIGGSATIAHADFTDLGFWSGNTGGLALTGADVATADAPIAPAPTDPASSAETPGDEEPTSEVPEDEGLEEEAPTDAGPEPAQTLSAGELSTITADELPDPGLVTATVQDVSTTGNAFGLFISRATGVAVTDARVSASLVDGVVFHRFVQGAAIRTSQVTGNAVDGIVIDRSSSSVRLEDVTSSANGRNGISFDGRPLADGPSAIGTPVSAYGDVHVVGGHVSDNARYGVEILGGSAGEIVDTSFSSNLVGIVLSHGASEIQISRNSFADDRRQSIALRGGVHDARISDNTISAVDTGIHLRNSSGTMTGNTFSEVSNHAITLTGTATGTRVTGNVIAGYGSTAIYDDASGAVVKRNDIKGWETAPTVISTLRSIFQPLTIIWVCLGLLLVITALSGRGHGSIRHPYADRLPLTALSRGVVSPDELRGSRP